MVDLARGSALDSYRCERVVPVAQGRPAPRSRALREQCTAVKDGRDVVELVTRENIDAVQAVLDAAKSKPSPSCRCLGLTHRRYCPQWRMPL